MDLWNGSTLIAEPFKFRASNASIGPIFTICGKLVVHAKPAKPGLFIQKVFFTVFQKDIMLNI